MRMKSILVFALVVGGTLVAAAGSLGAAGPGTPENPTLSHCLVSLIQEAQIPAQEQGVITSLKVREGQAVKKGEVIALIDDAIPQAERRKALAEEKAAQEKASSDVDIRYATAASGVAKFEYLKNVEANARAKGAVSEVEVQRSKLAWDRAVLQIEQSQLEQRISKLTADTKSAEVEATEEAIRHRQIRSPLDGVIVQVTPHEGEWMKPGDTIARVLRLDRLQVEGFLNTSEYAPHVIDNRNVIVSVPLAGFPQPVQFKGKIIFVSPSDEAGGEYRVKAEVENRSIQGQADQWLLRPGATVTMTIELN
jgi:multidrug efflux pump subunit AcrA (membrane-fusion protein)